MYKERHSVAVNANTKTNSTFLFFSLHFDQTCSTQSRQDSVKWRLFFGHVSSSVPSLLLDPGLMTERGATGEGFKKQNSLLHFIRLINIMFLLCCDQKMHMELS